MQLTNGEDEDALRGTLLGLNEEYLEAIAGNNAAGALEYLRKQRFEAVDDGNPGALPALYTQSAVWKIHTGSYALAEKDLKAALRCGQLTEDAVTEVHVLLVNCYRRMGRPDSAEASLQLLRHQIRSRVAISALLLKQVLECLADADGPAGATPTTVVERPDALSAAASPAAATPAPGPAAVSQEPTGSSAAATAAGSARNGADSLKKAPPLKKSGGLTPGFFGSGSSGSSTTTINGKTFLKPREPTVETVSDSDPDTDQQRRVVRTTYHGAVCIEEEVPSAERGTADGVPPAAAGSSATPREPEPPVPAHSTAARQAPPAAAAAPAAPTGAGGAAAAAAAAAILSGQATRNLNQSTERNFEDVLRGHVKVTTDLNMPLDQQRRIQAVMGFPVDGCVDGHAHIQMVEQNHVIGQCVEQINMGEYARAEATLTQVLQKDPKCYQALVARGTCRALAGQNSESSLRKADLDFSKAIELLPDLADVWKRRSQARAAIGRITDATTDLEQAICKCVFESQESFNDVLRDLALLYHRQRNFRKARMVFNRFLEVAAANEVQKETYSMLGLACTAMGDIDEGVKHYRQALSMDPNYKEAWLNLFQAYKECGKVDDAEKAFRQIARLDSKEGTRSMAAYRFRAHMFQCMGQHAKAVEILTEALSPLNGKTLPDQRIECFYLRGACNHAMGRLANAYADYDSAFGTPTTNSTPQEARNFQAVAFYQGEICVYLQRKLDLGVLHFCVDRDLDPEFKECWAKQIMPPAKLLQRCPKLLKRNQKFPADRKDPQLPTDTDLTPLVNMADHLGKLLQYTHQGFMSNRRQQRAAGFGSIELAQRILQEVDARRNGTNTRVSSEGASGGKDDEQHDFGWRDAMDVLVRWRQIGEPNDQVLWVDLLTPEEFNNGFGSHTPMFSGQTKCVRYYMNCQRGLRLFRDLVLEGGYVVNAENQQVHLTQEQLDKVKKATMPPEMYEAVGVDSWVVVPIKSVSRANHMLEGTRLTITKAKDQPDAHEFSIRTPVTPLRWKDFNEELTAAFEAICAAAVEGDKPKASRSILEFVYYWYNFMPLARGSAAVGYTTILTLFWAFGMPVSVSIPKDYQTDWEAILCRDPELFIKELSTWLLPPPAFTDPNKGHKDDAVLSKYCEPAARDDFPDLLRTLGNVRKRFYALNYGTEAAVQARAGSGSGRRK